MNTQDYIASGILEMYISGSLDETESKEVARAISTYPEIEAEYIQLQVTLENYAQSLAIAPPSALKNKLIGDIEIQLANANKKAETPTKSIFISPNNNPLNWLAAASILIALITSVLSGYFWTKWKNAEGQLISMQQENRIFAQNANYIIDSSLLLLEEKNASFSFITDTATTKIVLKGLPISPDAAALVFWNKSTKEVFLDVKSLPIPQEGMQYQLWALDNGVPIDAGVFDLLEMGSLQKLKSINNAQAFAVTLEKSGGSLVPTLEMIHILGSI